MAPSRARSSWSDWPSTATLIRAQDLEVWDAGVLDLKTQTFRIKDYGGGTNTAATDTAAIGAAIAAATAAGGGTILFEKNTTNVINATKTLSSNLRFFFDEGSVLDCSSMTGTSTNVFQTLPGTYTESTNVTNLSANATRGDKTVSIAAGAEVNFSVNDYVKIKSNANWAPETLGANATLDGWIGELGKVKSIAVGVLTLWWPLLDSYATADTATVGTIATFSNIIFEGTGRIVGRSGATRDRFIMIDKGISPRVSGLQMFAFADVYVGFRDVLFGIADEIYCEADGTSTSSSDYGVDFAFATQWSSMTNSTFRGVRHCATTDNILNVRAGVPRFLTYAGNRAFNTRASSYDTHSYGEYINIIGNHSYNPVDAGVNARAPNMIVANNTIIKPGGYGVFLRNQTDRRSRYVVEGNYIREPAFGGVLYRNPAEPTLAGTTAGQNIAGVVINGNLIEDCSREGILCDSDAAFQLKNITVTGNQVYYGTANVNSGIRFINCTASNIFGNIVDGAGTGIRMDDASTGCIVMGNNLPNCTTQINRGAGANHILTTADKSGAYNEGVTTTIPGPFSAGFENGTLAATVASTDPGDADKWTAVTIGASASLIYDDTHVYKGVQSAKITTGGSSVQSLMEWDFAAVTDHYGRLVAYFTANPSTGVNLVRANDSSTLSGEINLDTTGKLRLVNAAGTVVATSTNVIPLNQFFMLQWHFTHNAATGTMEIKIYTNPTDVSPLETLTATGLNTGAQATIFRVGCTTSAASIGPFWIDSVTAIAAAYPGTP